MKVTVEMAYSEEYLPSKRHRIPRKREVSENREFVFKETTKDKAPVALRVTRPGSRSPVTELRWYDGRLWEPKTRWSGTEFLPDNVEELTKQFRHEAKTRPSGSRAMVTNHLNGLVADHLIVDGNVYAVQGEPYYTIGTYGLGNNHGGTALNVEYAVNGKVMFDHYFNALQRKEALAEAQTTAILRGDTNSVKSLPDTNIEVILPDAVKISNSLPFVNLYLGQKWDLDGERFVRVWPFEDAPIKLQNFSNHDGKESFVILTQPDFKDTHAKHYRLLLNGAKSSEFRVNVSGREMLLIITVKQ